MLKAKNHLVRKRLLLFLLLPVLILISHGKAISIGSGKAKPDCGGGFSSGGPTATGEFIALPDPVSMLSAL